MRAADIEDVGGAGVDKREDGDVGLGQACARQKMGGVPGNAVAAGGDGTSAASASFNPSPIGASASDAMQGH